MINIIDDNFGKFVAVLFVALLLGAYAFGKERCSQQSASFEESRYTVVGGCMVKHNGRWLPLENIRGFDDKG